MPVQTSPGQTRSAFPSLCPGGNEKLARGTESGLRVRVGSANVGTMRGREGEVVEMVGRRRLNFCCLQETRWRGGSARKLGGYKFYWQGCEEGTAGVGMLVKEEWVEND